VRHAQGVGAGIAAVLPDVADSVSTPAGGHSGPSHGELRVGEASSRAATDALLGGLAAGRFSPAAWSAFGLATLRRSLEQVAAHPQAASELSLLHAAFAVLAPPRRRRWVGASWLLAITHLGLLGPARSLGAPSTLSLARANLPAVATGSPWVCLAALASDKADGALARRLGPTQFGHYADSLADAAFWAWFAARHETDRRVLAAAALAWLAPVAAVGALSIGRGHMVEVRRSRWLRPAAAMQVLLTVRAFRRARR